MDKINKERWHNSIIKLKNVNFWNDTELPSNKYTALASYAEIINGITIEKGKCMNIDSNNTISQYICCNCFSNIITKITNSKLIYSIILFNILGILCILYILLDYSYKSLSYLGALCWLVIPIILFLDSNITILKRIWLKTFKPWIHLYASLLETIAFCDICGWDFRTFIIFPAMLFNQINIINSDAVYFKLKTKSIPLIQIILSIMWKFFMIYCLRFGYFENIHPRNMIVLSSISNNNTNMNNTNTETIFYLNNVSLFFTKSMSLFIILCGEAYFKIKHTNKLYFLHTNYTIKKNKEWNIMNRNERIYKKQSLNKQVINIKQKIKTNNFSSIQNIVI
tara:strand:- start:348 stop:1361 length:1014 start_codon:yes stop_codon:yes gene_type:complete